MCFCSLQSSSPVAAGGNTMVQSSGDSTRGQALLHASGHLVYWMHFCRDDQPAPAVPGRLCEPFPSLLKSSTPSLELSTEPDLLSGQYQGGYYARLELKSLWTSQHCHSSLVEICASVLLLTEGSTAPAGDRRDLQDFPPAGNAHSRDVARSTGAARLQGVLPQVEPQALARGG